MCIEGNPKLTTHYDYVSKPGGQIQTTSYLFMKTENTGQVSPQVVINQKSPTQHVSELYSLKEKLEMASCFEGSVLIASGLMVGLTKVPVHVEVQFRWTEWHLQQQKKFTIVTRRSSGSSCCNPVELQNGVIGRAHVNLFIPSTMQPETVNDASRDKLWENMEAVLQGSQQYSIWFNCD